LILPNFLYEAKKQVLYSFLSLIQTHKFIKFYKLLISLVKFHPMQQQNINFQYLITYQKVAMNRNYFRFTADGVFQAATILVGLGPPSFEV